MKRLLTILAFLLLAAPAMAGEPVIATEHSVVGASAVVFPGTSTITLEDPWTQLARMNPAVLGSGGGAAASNYCDTKSGYLVCEDFDSSTSCESGSDDSNCRNTWISKDACGVTTDYAYTAGKLDGTNSALLSESAFGATCSKYINFTSGSPRYIFLRLKIGVITLANSGDYIQVPIRIYNTDAVSALCQLCIYNNSGSIVWSLYNNLKWTHSEVTPEINTEYYIWMDFTKNTSGGCVAYISTNATKPSATITSSNNTLNTDAGSLFIGSVDNVKVVDNIIFDDILVDDAVIGNQ